MSIREKIAQPANFLENLSIDRDMLVSLIVTRLSSATILISRFFLRLIFLTKNQGFWYKQWQSSITLIFNFFYNLSITVEDKTLKIWMPGTCQALYWTVQIFWANISSFLTFSIFIKSHASKASQLYNISISKSYSWKVISSPIIIFISRSEVNLALLIIRVNFSVSQFV